MAVEIAREVANDYPDGVWFVDLTAVSDVDLVVDVVVSTIGFAASAGATPPQDLRRYLQSRRILLVLDNCEHVLPSVDQIVRVTLPYAAAMPESAFLTTSREPIGLDGETIWTLDPLGLPGGDAEAARAPAVGLFRQRLAAARALSHSLDDIAAQVRDDPSRLGRIGRVGRSPRDHLGHGALGGRVGPPAPEPPGATGPWSTTSGSLPPWPRRSLTDRLLAATRENLGARDYERAWQDGERLRVEQVT